MQIFSGTHYTVKPFIRFVLLAVALLALFRFGLMSWQVDRVGTFSDAITILTNGLRIDLSSLGYLLILPALVHSIFASSKYRLAWHHVLRGWFFACLMLLAFFEVATPTFILEYDLRPNRLFIEYLMYPKEVFGMLLSGHLLALVVTSIVLSIFSVVNWKVISFYIIPKEIVCKSSDEKSVAAYPKVSNGVALVSSLILVVTLFGFARGTTGHRPINPSLVYFSTDPLINSLTLNSLYSVAFAIKQLGDEMHASSVYGNLSDDEVIEIVRTSAGSRVNRSEFNSSSMPTLRDHVPTYQGKPKNLVIILEESLGAQFVSHLGGKNITPNIDNLMQQGWAFNQLYATGTRSVRGIEAIVTGFTPTPARSVVKLANSQQNFFTIAELLKRQSYTTQFIYGGESHFDNMKSFFLGNGFEDIVDFDDIKDPLFVASWGACDVSLFNQADLELTALSKSKQPFFSLIFTSSNHDPFDIPAGIVPVNDGEDDRDRAIRFADYALGKFMDKAKRSSYWDNTLFLVVADHDARNFGAELVPIKSFHIPGVILGKDVLPKQDSRVVSQIDLAPTLLSLMGVESRHPMLGNDLTNNDVPERAMMQFDKNFAYMKGQEVAILQPNKDALYFRYDNQAKRLVPDDANAELGRQALGHALFGSKAYEKQWYRLEDEVPDLLLSDNTRQNWQK
jgi:phosphoglycerol transferase MdoB-like AlkP superfamily enzyme